MNEVELELLIHDIEHLTDETDRHRHTQLKMPDLVASIDAGTTSIRFMIFDSTAAIVASHQKEFTQHYPHPGWHEQDAEEIITVAEECIAEACKKLGQQGKYSPADIKAVGITNQRETTVVWDKETGKPLAKAIAWPDTRTTHTVHQLAKKSEKGKDAVKEETGLPLSTYFAAVKLRWLLDNVEEVKKAHDEKTMLFGTIDCWILHNLTGRAVHITDSSNASRTMFMDLQKQTWDPKLLEFFGVDAAILPEIRSSAEVYGEFGAGPLQGVKIAGMAGDQMAALVGNKCLKPGEAKNTYGEEGVFFFFPCPQSRRAGMQKLTRAGASLPTACRYRRLPALQHRHQARLLPIRPPHHNRLQSRAPRARALRARGQHRRRGECDQVDPRLGRDHPGGERGGDVGGRSGGSGRGLFCHGG